MTMEQKAYRAFLKTGFWKELTERKKQEIGECEQCGSKHKLQSHHIRYPNDWYETKMNDLRVLCRYCHMDEHGLISHKPFFDEDPEIDWFFHQKEHLFATRIARNKPLRRKEKRFVLRHVIRFKDNHRVMFHCKMLLKFGAII